MAAKFIARKMSQQLMYHSYKDDLNLLKQFVFDS